MDSEMQDGGIGSAGLNVQNPSTTIGPPMQHENLAIRRSPNRSRAPAAAATVAEPSQQEAFQAVINTNTHPNMNSITFPALLSTAASYQMMLHYHETAIKGDLLDVGPQTMDDIAYFMQNLHYPARDVTRVQISVSYLIKARGREPVQATAPRRHSAAHCATFGDLISATAPDWYDAFHDLNLTPPADGVQARDVLVWTKRSYGDNKYDWIEAPNSGDYDKWYVDYVVHGRSMLLYVTLRYRRSV